MDDISTGILISLLVLLIVISGYFSGSETGMMALNRYRLRHLSKSGHSGAKRVEKLLTRPDRLIGLILIGNNLVNILASSIATVLGLRLYGDAGIAIATGVLTMVILVFAEVTPKTLAALYPERVSFISSHLLTILMKVFYPLVSLVNFITNGFLRLLGIGAKADGKDNLSTEELRTIVNEAGSLIPRRHQHMLLSILELEEVTVDDIMVPRNEITGININDDWKSIMRQFTHAPHGRMVLYRDTIDEVVGMLRVRKAYRLMVEKNEFNKETLLRAADEVYFIPEGTPLNVQMLKFQRNKQRIGLVVDEYGDMIGLVTLEDILEEIVGEFTTSLSPSLAEEITSLTDGGYLIEGSANIRDLNKSLNWTLPTDGPRTLNGLILEHLEDIPKSRLSIEIDGHHIEIVDVADNMIKQVKVLPTDQPDANISV
ncbi:magnesium/cobalt efflux protein [Salinivibrio sp. MA351]|uniref:Magnesium/cobalt efflux protein n=1 Tax=Salinivibrio costicola subsp. alcaliphilus TaxID=272773 RepID=A0ABX3KMY7_SALCS|nr:MULTISPECIES: CNNM domain-containing protein [Salinivibrio]OOE99605.1 magnesium/cobalt efflux protein [Salinivibrio sp. IB643]OOF01279.1 magnesium/cobalt efflux protein [Salinivibrio sp. MA351]OOF05397.1 magnesium/cobalt efflux protein [Salinivibrio sp. MA607]OOF06561.1 magnesium/cobalt efflux protein [Salinivibrio sp. MA440]OOF19785.1 magnesium/cobalt efflux protein [Salinivibrio sp. MA427]